MFSRVGNAPRVHPAHNARGDAHAVKHEDAGAGCLAEWATPLAFIRPTTRGAMPPRLNMRMQAWHLRVAEATMTATNHQPPL